MSMDGRNRTVVVGVNTSYYGHTIRSLTLDYQAQVLYWAFGDGHNHTLSIKCSNIDGTNKNTLLQLNESYYYDYYYYHYHHSRHDLWVAVYNKTLFLSLPWKSEVYKLGINGENFITFISSSTQAFCRFWYHQIKVTNQPSG